MNIHNFGYMYENVFGVKLYLQDHWRIWGGGGRAGHTPPPWDPILSFSHTFSLKSVRVGGPHPPLMGARPPYGKSWIRH